MSEQELLLGITQKDTCHNWLLERLGADWTLRSSIERIREQGDSVYKGVFEDVQLQRAINEAVGGLFSASHLETYAQCPYRFLLSYVWKQQQYEELTETVEPAVEGSLLHDVLARFMAGHLHEKLTKYPPTELISQLDDIMTSVCDEYITGKKIAVTDFWPSQRRKLNLLLRRWLQRELVYQKKWEPFVPVKIEWDFGRNGSAPLVLEVNGGTEKCHILKPLQPTWEEGTMKRLENVPYDLGGGQLTIHCRYGNILPTKSNAIYYKGNMASSGVELRINGRAIEHGLFDRVWGEAIHPSQNRFLVQVDLITDNSAALPATKNTKTSFCEADPRLNKLFRWIATYVPAPPKDADTIEARYVKELAAKCESNPDALRVSREEPVFQKIGLKAKVDLFVGCVNGVTIYEAKAGKTKALDLYQLRMYVDGCALDNKPVDEAILIARYHPPEVRELLDILNGLSAPDGRPYNFRLVTWDEEGIFVQQSA